MLKTKTLPFNLNLIYNHLPAKIWGNGVLHPYTNCIFAAC